MALDLLLAPAALPFTGALAVAAALAVVEVGGVLLGVSGLTGDADADAGGLEADSGGVLAALMGWANPGRLPLLAWLMVACLAFGLSGLAAQSLAALALGAYLPPWLAALPALAVGMPATRALARALARILPRDESHDPDPMAFVGCRGSISIGPAEATSPGRALVTDRRGHTRNLAVVPEPGMPPIPTGCAVEIIWYDGTLHHAAPRALPD